MSAVRVNNNSLFVKMHHGFKRAVSKKGCESTSKKTCK